MRQLEILGIIIQIALRNLFASRLKTLIVGFIIWVGAIFIVFGVSLLNSVVQGMENSIIDSAAGHLQVYNSKSKDDLSLFGGMMGDADLEPLEDFSKVKRLLLSVPNVKTVIPQGIAQAFASSGNQFDFALAKLRDAARKRVAGEEVPSEQYAALKDHVRQMIALLEKDTASLSQMVDEKAIDPQARADLQRASQDGFWNEFDQAPLESLEFLENRIAPQSVDGDFLQLRYIGTDLDAFLQTFDRLRLVEGELVPKGQRGIVFPKLFYEEMVKLKTAARLDKIKEARELNHKRIATDDELKRAVKENVTQVREIVIQLDSLMRQEMVARLQRGLGSQETDVSKLLASLLETDDTNFDARYRLFYEQVAPLVKLYQVSPGDTITIKAFTRSGYMKSVNVKLYGIVTIKGLEKAGFAGMMALVDLMTFRDLYGYMSAEQVEEVKKLKAASGAREVKRETAEADLFGSDAVVTAPSTTSEFDELEALRAARSAPTTARAYSTEEIEQGVALNAAVLLHDPSQAKQTAEAIQKAAEQAHMDLKVVDWQQAAGLVGKLILVLQAVLLVLSLIIFVIALIIIINSMVMATLQRVKEIGTLRAIGAQRRFLVGMVTIESVVIGLLFGLIGAATGAALVALAGRIGFPAWSQETFFVFSGPRLHPWLSPASVVLALGVVLVVSILAAIYPAILATRVTPVEAMLSED